MNARCQGRHKQYVGSKALKSTGCTVPLAAQAIREVQGLHTRQMTKPRTGTRPKRAGPITCDSEVDKGQTGERIGCSIGGVGRIEGRLDTPSRHKGGDHRARRSQLWRGSARLSYPRSTMQPSLNVWRMYIPLLKAKMDFLIILNYSSVPFLSLSSLPSLTGFQTPPHSECPNQTEQHG